MKKLTLLSVSIQSALLLTAASVANVYAVEIEELAEKKIERIEVTGSRILREGAIAPSPVTVISGEDILNTGAVSLGEALKKLPALSSTQSLTGGNNSHGIGQLGLSVLNLRGMGSARTLVLVNGKRHVSGIGGSASVDINTIPAVWLERVEIITGGASAVYGADAVTGVVNFILKDNITGFDASATRSESELSKFKTERYSFSYGTDFSDGRGNIAIAAEYAGQNTLNATDHPWTKDSKEFVNGNLVADAGAYIVNNAGYFGLGNNQYTFNQNGSIQPLLFNGEIDGIVCSDCDYINLQEYVETQPEFNRWNVNFKTNYDVTDNINVYFEAKQANSSAVAIGQATFDFGILVGRENPYLHPSVADAMDAAGTNSIFINRMNDDLGRRTEASTRETTRFVLGAKGGINDNWDFDVSFVHGKTKSKRVHSNNRVESNFQNAVNAIEDGNGNIVCFDEEARANGCVPINIMGEGSISQAGRDYINIISRASGEITQTVITGSVVNSALFDMPAGEVGFAGGTEYRKEENTQNEPDNVAGTFLNILGEDNGSFNVKEAFVEFSMPLVTDVTLVQDLTLDAAVRYADYSTSGNATSWKLGFDWAVNDELRFRATQSEAVRAPSITEIFGQKSQTFTFISDPCKASNLANSNNPTRVANCAALGVPSDFNSDYDSRTISGYSSGNPNIQPEESTSTTVGFIYQPEFLNGFVITADYWTIELSDAISSFTTSNILSRCVDSEGGVDNQFCALVPRDPNSHEITEVNNVVLNVAGQDVTGVDFELGYDFSALGGEFGTRVLAQYLKEKIDFPFQDEPEQSFDSAGQSLNPKWQGLFSVDYRRGQLFASWSTRYVDRVSNYSKESLALNPTPSNAIEVGSYFVSDASVGYDFNSGLSLRLGIDNILGRKVPFNSVGSSSNITNGDASFGFAYDRMGRLGYLTLSYSM